MAWDVKVGKMGKPATSSEQSRLTVPLQHWPPRKLWRGPAKKNRRQICFFAILGHT